ncbi:hypothetical protein RHS01_09800 [Rhizoctonia solani]|uniref:Transmembrane protein n=1 Tax=Rhizoctonia solani TaxID=456999 RepID=A0A8H7I5Y0_9AGAM|nr:hypothetical protein RHS01_09800 [Rhizoctonia solani]
MYANALGTGRWNRGNSGAFKRVMTYSYLTSVPLLMLYSITMVSPLILSLSAPCAHVRSQTVIKYEEGYAAIPTVGIVPRPYQLWTHPQRHWVEAIYIAFSVAWALEIVSHLEELCFWLFLINVGAAQTSWFRSIHFKCWVVGSVLAITGLPIIAVFTRENPLKCEAWTIFVGSIGSLLITLWFLRVLWLFPAFLRRVKNEGAEPEVVVRLSTFHELNIIRVVFRFMFVLPLLTLAADGIKPHHNHVNESPFWTDLLAMLGAIGCIVSSIITLLVHLLPPLDRQRSRVQTTPKDHVPAFARRTPPRTTPPHPIPSATRVVIFPLARGRQGPAPVREPTTIQQPGYGYRAPTIKIAGASNRAAVTGGGAWERVGPAGEEMRAGGVGGAWEMVDYHQYQQHGVILPTHMPRTGSRRETALHPWC